MKWSPAEVLIQTRSILLIDWPSRDVPDTLSRAGLEVVSADGPDTYNAYVLEDGEVRARRVDGPPDRVDLVYAFRPIDELPRIVAQTLLLGARAVWLERVGSQDVERARHIIESAGLIGVIGTPITTALGQSRQPSPADSR